MVIRQLSIALRFALVTSSLGVALESPSVNVSNAFDQPPLPEDSRLYRTSLLRREPARLVDRVKSSDAVNVLPAQQNEGEEVGMSAALLEMEVGDASVVSANSWELDRVSNNGVEFDLDDFRGEEDNVVRGDVAEAVAEDNAAEDAEEDTAEEGSAEEDSLEGPGNEEDDEDRDAMKRTRMRRIKRTAMKRTRSLKGRRDGEGRDRDGNSKRARGTTEKSHRHKQGRRIQHSALRRKSRERHRAESNHDEQKHTPHPRSLLFNAEDDSAQNGAALADIKARSNHYSSGNASEYSLESDGLTCPTAFTPVKDVADCKAGAKSLNIRFHHAGSWAQLPRGCFGLESSRTIWFNMNSAGKASEGFSLVCRQAVYTTNPADKEELKGDIFLPYQVQLPGGSVAKNFALNEVGSSTPETTEVSSTPETTTDESSTTETTDEPVDEPDDFTIPKLPAVFTIQNVNSDLFLNAVEIGGTYVVQQGGESGGASRWEIQEFDDPETGEKRYTIKNLGANRYLQASSRDENQADSEHPQIFIANLTADNVTEEVTWKMTMFGGGYYGFHSVTSGQWLNVEGGATDEGAQINLWDNEGSTHSQWILEEPGTMTGPEGTYAEATGQMANPMENSTNGPGPAMIQSDGAEDAATEDGMGGMTLW